MDESVQVKVRYAVCGESRLGALTFVPAFRRGLVRAPLPQTMFLRRKLVGSSLVCARIRARVDVRALIMPFLDLPNYRAI